MAGTFTRMINGMHRTIQIDQEVTIAAAATSKVVTFPVTLQTGSTTPRVSAWIFNSADANPQYIAVDITARSATGFTAKWNDPTDTANYILLYIVADGWRP